MALLWADAAAHQLEAAWWNAQREFEHEGDDEYPLRDPGESMSARRQRYVSHVVDQHNIPRSAARAALAHVTGHLKQNATYAHPSDYGFASAPGRTDDFEWGAGHLSKIMNPETWRHRPVTQVPTGEIHASQNFIRPASVAHNMFYPGRKEPEGEEHAVGDPDADPADYGSDEEREHDPLAKVVSDEDVLHGTAKFFQHRDGRMTCIDGHHRAGADMIMGKKTTPGQVLTERELDEHEHRDGGKQAIEDPWGPAIHQHLIEHHGWAPDSIASERGARAQQEQTSMHEDEHDRYGHEFEHYHPEE